MRGLLGLQLYLIWSESFLTGPHAVSPAFVFQPETCGRMRHATMGIS